MTLGSPPSPDPLTGGARPPWRMDQVSQSVNSSIRCRVEPRLNRGLRRCDCKGQFSNLLHMVETAIRRLERRNTTGSVATDDPGGRRAQEARTSAAGPAEASQVSLVAGACNSRFLRLVERVVPRLVASRRLAGRQKVPNYGNSVPSLPMTASITVKPQSRLSVNSKRSRASDIGLRTSAPAEN